MAIQTPFPSARGYFKLATGECIFGKNHGDPGRDVTPADSKAEAEATRDTYAQANAGWAEALHDDNILLYFLEKGKKSATYQKYEKGAWVDNSGLIGLEIPKLTPSRAPQAKTTGGVDAKKVAQLIATGMRSKADKDMGNVEPSAILDRASSGRFSAGSDGQVLVKSGDSVTLKDITPSGAVAKTGQSVQYVEITTPQPLTLTADITVLTLQGTEGEEFVQELPPVEEGKQIYLRLLTSGKEDEMHSTDYRLTASSGDQIAGAGDWTATDVQRLDVILLAEAGTRNWVEFLDVNYQKFAEHAFSPLTVSNMDSPDSYVSVDHLQLEAPLVIGEAGMAIAGGTALEKSTKILKIDENFLDSATTPDGYYASLSDNITIEAKDAGKFMADGSLWFDQTNVGSRGYVQVDRMQKSIGLQEDDMKDPNISGGTPALYIARVSMLGYAMADGVVELVAKGADGSVLKRADGEPFAVRKSFKTGDKLGDLVLADIQSYKGITPIVLHLEHSFAGETIVIGDKLNGNSCVCVQYLHKDSQTGEALQAFMTDNGIRVLFDHRYYGEYIAGTAMASGLTIAEAEIPAGAGETTRDGLHFYNATPVVSGVADGKMSVKSNDTGDLAFFTFGVELDAEKTRVLIGSKVRFHTSVRNPNCALHVDLCKWLGKPDEQTSAIITGTQNSQPIVSSGWEIADTAFIAENATGNYADFSCEFTLPSGENNLAVVIRPQAEQSPVDVGIDLTKTRLDSELNQTLYTLSDIEQGVDGAWRDSVTTFSMKCPSNFDALRYTINAGETKIPVGSPDKTTEFKLVRAWTDAGGTKPIGEGVIEACRDFSSVKIYGGAKVYYGESATGEETVTFKIKKADGTEVGETYSMLGKEQSPMQMSLGSSTRPFVVKDVKKGDQFWVYATANVDDGAFIQNSAGKSLVTLVLESTEVI